MARKSKKTSVRINKKQNKLLKFIRTLDKKGKFAFFGSISVIVVCIAVITALFVKSVLPSKIMLPPQETDESGLDASFYSDEVVNFMVCGVDSDSTPGRTGGLADVIMVASLNKIEKSVNILQIPRDTFVGDHITTGKINAVYSLAAEKRKAAEMKKCIEQTFHIPINHYVITTMDALITMVDGIGGFSMNLPATIRLDGVHIPKGLQEIDGKEAAAIIRTRYSASRNEYYYNGGDIMRLETQGILMKALAKKLTSSPFNLITEVLPKVYDKLITDLTIKDITDYARFAMDIDVDNSVKNFIAPGSSTMHNGFSIWNIDAAKIMPIINGFFLDPNSPKLTLSDLSIPYGSPDVSPVSRSDETPDPGFTSSETTSNISNPNQSSKTESSKSESSKSDTSSSQSSSQDTSSNSSVTSSSDSVPSETQEPTEE